MITLVRIFRADRRLAAVTLVLAILCLLPLREAKILPFIDMPHHAALAGLLWDLVWKRHDAHLYYALDLRPMPYWTSYVVLAVAQAMFGVYRGVKIVVALTLLVVPLGGMRLAVALRKSPWVALPGFLLAWDFNLYFGWLNFVLAMGLTLFLLARLLEVETWKEAVATWPLGAVVALTHVLPIAFLGGALALATLVEPRRLPVRALGSAAVLATLAPWLVRTLAVPHVDPGYAFDTMDVRLQNVFAFTLGGGPVGREAVLAEGVALLLVVLAPYVLFQLPQVPATRSQRLLAATPLLAALALYCVLPLAVERPIQHWGIYQRYATVGVLSLSMLPSPRRVPWLFALPVVLVAAWTSYRIGAQLHAFDADVEPFYELADKIPGGARLLPLSYENGFASSRRAMGESLHGYITARVGGYNPYLFSQSTNPVHYGPVPRPPAPPGWGRNPSQFSMKGYGRFYDYILVLGAADPVARDPSAEGRAAHLVFRRGRFRLYRVDGADPAPPG